MDDPRKRRNPPQFTDFENYVLSRLDDFDARVRAVERVQWFIGAVAMVAAATHFVDPSQHWWIFTYP